MVVIGAIIAIKVSGHHGGGGSTAGSGSPTAAAADLITDPEAACIAEITTEVNYLIRVGGIDGGNAVLDPLVQAIGSVTPQFAAAGQVYALRQLASPSDAEELAHIDVWGSTN